MFIDTAKYRWFIAIAVGCSLIMLGALLLGFLGPSSRETVVDYAYECPNDSHIYSGLCSGVQLGKPGTVYSYELPTLSTLNGYWSTIVYPYNIHYQTTSVSETLVASVSILGRDENTDPWELLVEDEIESEVLLCDEGNDLCWGFVLVYESTIRYPNYMLNVTFPDSYTENQESKQYIGDVAFEYQWYNLSFIEEQMSLRLIYLVIATCLIFVFWLRMRKIPYKEWSIEQISVASLLLALIALNNPFYPFEFLIPGSFFPILDCFLQVIHQSVLFLYWLFMFDYLRKGACSTAFVKYDWAKLIVVFVYGCLTFVLFTWFRIVDFIDPVFGETQDIIGLVFLFFFDAILFGALVVWVLMLMILSVPVVMKLPHLKARFLMATIPAVILISSLVIALFFGIFGPVQRTAPAFVYFFTAYNLYAIILLIGYWPTESAFKGAFRNPSENTPIFGSDANYSEFQQDKEYINDDQL